MHKIPLTPLSNAFLPGRKEGEQLVFIGATHAEIIILQAALRHYHDYISYDKDLQAKTTPFIQRFIQRLHDQFAPAREQIE